MDKYVKLRESLRNICGNRQEGQALLFQARVVSVEADSCTVDLGGLELSDVRLKAVADGETKDVLLVVPAPGSRVLVGSLTGDYRDLAVLSVERFDRWQFGGDKYGGLVKAPGLVERLNVLEKNLNDLKQLVSGWKPVPQDGGASLQLALQSWLAGTLTETRQTDIENTKIVHG